MRTFGGIDPRYALFDKAAVLLQSIPYDGTSTWGKGADQGFDAFLEAAENMELYDIETDSEVYKVGIHILPEIREKSSPESVYHAVKKNTRKLLKHNKLLTFFGGEHSISIGIIEAFLEKYPGLTVLQLDAHADLRDSYDGTPYNHACAMHAASRYANLIQVGIRSMDRIEMQFMDPDKCFTAEMMKQNGRWIQNSLDLMGEEVYITLDLDVLDPSIMPSTGTPEPGGMLYYEILEYLREVFYEKKVVGFDIVEFAPLEGLNAPGFTVAKLYYKLLSYYFKNAE
ncbi:MAG: agmatinase [Bacteroidales bacterium]|nr:agmatinase [Bacteroidales bacterium]